MNEYMAFGSNGNYSITFMKPSQLIFVTCGCLRFKIKIFMENGRFLPSSIMDWSYPFRRSRELWDFSDFLIGQ